MSDSISRRDFLKKTSAVGLAAAVTPMATLAAPASAKTRVVIATDKACISATGGPVAAKIQDVVDNAIMTLSGKPTKGAAYEALFPAAVTSSTGVPHPSQVIGCPRGVVAVMTGFQRRARAVASSRRVLRR